MSENTMGSLIADIAGTDLTDEDRDLLAHPIIGGVILFARNYCSKPQLSNLCKELKSIPRTCPLLILTDQEGGRVQRFKNEFTTLPTGNSLGRVYDQSPNEAHELAYASAYVMASEIKACGLDFSLMPVLDLDKKMNTVIGDRAFHHKPSIVAELANAYLDGLNDAGVFAIGKHFPGHGGVTADSHVDRPTDSRDYEALLVDDLIPFKKLSHRLNGIMTAHIQFPMIDKLPVSFSPKWLKSILREELKFDKAILSDDLNMQGAQISANPVELVCLAREAGCDFILYCNNRPAVKMLVTQLNPCHFQIRDEIFQKMLPAQQAMNPLIMNQCLEKLETLNEKLF